MLSEDSMWGVKWNGHVYKTDVSRSEAEAIAERLAKRATKNVDRGDHFEIFKDKKLIKEVNEMYQTAKRGENQTYKYVQYK
jgi:aromatic ring-cleaving dioxygenase